uniref:sigma-70 domain-containing protein n=1 Tax=Cyanothece sp. BG0011 TaxID=2082950 RepID=UPI0030DD0164
MSLHKFGEFLSIARQPISLDVRVGDNQDTELSELLEDQGVSPDIYITQELLRQDLSNLMAELTPQQRTVLTLRFGFRRWQRTVLSQNR